MSIALDPIKALPYQASAQIFSYLNRSELAICCQVSRDWQRLASAIQFGFQQLKSNQEVIDRVQDFINRISLGQNARFTCLISTGLRYQSIILEIKGSQDKAPLLGRTTGLTELDFKEDYIAIHGIGTGSLPVAPQHPPEYLPGFRQESLVLPVGGRFDHFLTLTRPANEGHFLTIKDGFERFIMLMRPFQGYFQARLVFPELPEPGHLFADPLHETDMELEIRNIMQINLDEFESQRTRKMCTTAAAVALLGVGVYFLYSTH